MPDSIDNNFLSSFGHSMAVIEYLLSAKHCTRHQTWQRAHHPAHAELTVHSTIILHLLCK